MLQCLSKAFTRPNSLWLLRALIKTCKPTGIDFEVLAKPKPSPKAWPACASLWPCDECKWPSDFKHWSECTWLASFGGAKPSITGHCMGIHSTHGDMAAALHCASTSASELWEMHAEALLIKSAGAGTDGARQSPLACELVFTLVVSTDSGPVRNSSSSFFSNSSTLIAVAMVRARCRDAPFHQNRIFYQKIKE